MPSESGISDQTKKIVIGAAVATATVGAGYLLYKTLNSSPSDLQKELEAIKTAGNDLFKQKNYQEASETFSKGIKLGEEKKSENTLVAMLYQNRAACREKIGDSAFDILNDCLAALKHDKKYAKAYLRAAKQLHTVGKKKDALTYLLAAFTLDEKLNKSNFEFFDQLLNIDFNDSKIDTVPGILDRKPAPLALYRIQLWFDTWDVMDLFKKDLLAFNPEDGNSDQDNYRKALDAIRNGKYEEVLEILTEENEYLPAMILRTKFLGYSIRPIRSLEALPAVEKALRSFETEDEQRKIQIQEAFDVLKLETCITMSEIETYLQNVTNDSENLRKFNLYTFAGILVYHGCVVDTSAATHEDQMIADTKNTSALLKIAEENGTLTPHTSIIKTFVELCSTNDYSQVHRLIREMEEITEKTPTHFILILMAKVYLMTGNIESAQKLMNEASKITTRYLVASRHLQMADTHLNKPDDVRVKGVTECALKAIEVDEFNHSAHILLLLGTNGPEPSIKRNNYENAMKHIQNAALFAPPRELLMLKKMLPLMNAKKRAAELLGIY